MGLLGESRIGGKVIFGWASAVVVAIRAVVRSHGGRSGARKADVDGSTVLGERAGRTEKLTSHGFGRDRGTDEAPAFHAYWRLGMRRNLQG